LRNLAAEGWPVTNIIDRFKQKHPTSPKALDRWTKLIEGADIGTPQDIRQIFGGNVDFVGGQAVFDGGGNKVRAITKISFGVKVVLVTHILTHIEYDKNKWKV
jgi:mRNA interferase HigB